MKITEGSKLGRYEARSLIGVGGMGEVYRAFDPKIGRDVAIKVLPADFSADKERVARFEQEAQAAGALNHPNIIAVYDVDTQDDILYVVSELLEGEELRQRLDEGPIPLRKVTEYAQQIVSGLTAAHEKGIVHRDLKPENLFITKDDRVKILDFGLAKLSEPPASAGGQIAGSEDATRARVNTTPGMVMGTVGYMSPEQVRGHAVDHRSDIFSFGVILYEMLTGNRAFQGDSVVETMNAILKEDVPEFDDESRKVPPSFDKIMRRCLEKKPEHRFYSAHDLGFALEALAGATTSSGQTAMVTATGPGGRWLNSSRLWMVSTVILGLALSAFVAFSLLRRASEVEAPPLVRYDVLPLDKTGLSLTRYPALTLSPDGATLAFVGVADGINRLYIRQRDDTEVRVLAGTEGAFNAVFSPDGNWLAFIADFTLKKVPLNGAVVSLTKVDDPRGLSWASDDTLVYAPAATGGLFQISADGGEPRALTTPDENKNERTHRWPQVTPDGKAVLFTVGSMDKPDDYDGANIEAVVLATGERRVVLQAASMARYVPSGHLIFARDSVLYAVRCDAGSLTVHGKPVAILTGVAGDKTTGAVHFSISDDGTLAYVPGSSASALRGLVWVDKSGNQTPVNIPRAQFNDPHISPDGSRVALLQGSSGSGDVWIYEFARATFTRLTFTTTNATPVWSADGKNIYYVSINSGASETTIFRRPADGSHEAESIVTIKHQAYLKAILPDGETALLDTSRQTNDANIMTVALKQGAQLTPVISASFMEYAAAVSPDGRWLAYQSNESGRPEIYVRDLAGSGGRWPISTVGGEEPRWSPDGRELYYRNNVFLMAVTIETRSLFQAGTPTSLFNELYDLRSNTGESYDVDPKGGRFLMIRPPKEDISTAQVRIVVNWFDELRRLVPAN